MNAVIKTGCVCVGVALSACLSQMKGVYFSIKQKVGFLLGASYSLVYNGLPGGNPSLFARRRLKIT